MNVKGTRQERTKGPFLAIFKRRDRVSHRDTQAAEPQPDVSAQVD